MSRWAPLLVVLLSLLALQPLCQPGLQQTDDGMHHLFRLFGLDQAIRAGHPGTRWLADEGFGYGFPVLNFYGPLTYYVGMVWHWGGLGFVASLEWTLAAGLVLAALTMYLFARPLLGPWGGALAAVAYVWAPYHLADAWTRGALAELWAFVWFPLLLLALWEVARGRGRALAIPVLWGGAALGGLILTHNLSVLLAVPVLVSWGVFVLLIEAQGAAGRWRALGGFVAMTALGVLFSAAFWLPALTEARYVWASRAPLDFEGWQQQLVTPGDLLSRGWVHRYEVLQAIGTLHPLGQAQVLLAVVGVAAGLWRWRTHERATRWALPLFTGLAALALFMQTPAAVGIWRSVPGLLLLQFPWRWQAVSTLCLAILSGYAVSGVKSEWAAGERFSGPPSGSDRVARPAGGRLSRLPYRGLLSLIVGTLVLMSSALPGLTWQEASYPTTDESVTDANVGRRTLAMYDYGRGLWLREHGSEWMFEYMPVWVQVPRSEFFLSAGPAQAHEVPVTAQVKPGRQAPLERRFQVSAPQPWTLQLHQFFFPGWQAIVDGRLQPAEPVGPLGLAGVQVPAGEHEVVLRFGSTPARRIGWTLSLIGTGLGLAGLLWLRRWRWLIVLALVAAGFLGLADYRRAVNPSDFTPAALTANFSNEIQLVGFHAPLRQLQPGGESAVLLQWLALRRPATDYKVFVHLVDEGGRLVAQHDGMPGFWFSPTTRWQRGELIADWHVLEWRGDLPGQSPLRGHYRLFAGLYDPATGQRLPLIGPDGTVQGDQVLLGEFDL